MVKYINSYYVFPGISQLSKGYVVLSCQVIQSGNSVTVLENITRRSEKQNFEICCGSSYFLDEVAD